MKRLLLAEWRRLLGNPVNRILLGVAALLLGAAAALSGLEAARYRAVAAGAVADWERGVAEAALALPATAPPPSPGQAKDAFEFARRMAPPAQRQPGGGLVLAAGSFAQRTPAIQVSVEPRHVDGRRSDPIANPLLRSLGMPDFGAVTALLLPLLVIALSYGMVHEARELGIWRVVCAQARQPWRVAAAALLVRLTAAWSVAALASTLAFALDPGATWQAWAAWLLALAAAALAWTALAGLVNHLRMPPAAAAGVLLAAWIAGMFVAPAALGALAAARHPAPMPHTVILRTRAAQDTAEQQEAALLARWFDAHPDQRSAITAHTWPVSFMPRFVAQDAAVAPLLRRVADARAAQADMVAAVAWLSPSLALTVAAERLADADAAHHAAFLRDVDRYEQRWRDWATPPIMGYRGLVRADVDSLPRFVPGPAGAGFPAAPILGTLAAAAALLACWWRLRHGAARP
ncbi:ABC-2 type transport system permease protein [Pseudoduganella flava]|uniref:ABC-2 type transport system permease protein n=1 Tax=Pseudoduganella flava TaxID=871742 RepID=A0A562PKC2_9BURK|nr:DUF3526 domain-containing protein [Pseudoduganella flava]QGZ42236.1 DUF3526 domain-containing protein [Pseudoduganella flava]TWI44773.1 ABC-2 type transport system permease protein [Pseudoduganella flava]